MTALYRGQRDLAVEMAARADDSTSSLPPRSATSAASTPLDAGWRARQRLAYDGWTPLHLAAFFGQCHRRPRSSMQARDVRVSRNCIRNTPLHAAIAGGHSAIALLLSIGAPTSGAGRRRHTPLHIAAENGLTDVVRALLTRGADPFAVDADDRTPPRAPRPEPSRDHRLAERET